eukprot:CAMPEP_0114376802 /NCGR_PEP_ID=MMETSP0102-20121206/602_1 /TAXON_ID=38822 ORGANISM="Pteridomonas danica, Strain PT" /NCGR_SAMPLE_ID=MMETSP0102 /ASSEMBLY_ACC=CAM_ASM_000212 /LENGTH=828 /DNA_ID=CAMNT_0001531225 /DNA_START=181 /DNA_END=2665 /DNA_ORIENTATION=-
MESFVTHFASEVPLPPCGQVKVRCNLLDKFHILKRSPLNTLPALDFSLRPLLSLLSVENILIIIECLLSEAKVCLVSRKISLLTPTSNALLALLFPFSWQGAYIPVMPTPMLEILDAPVPFFVGVYHQSLVNTFGDNFEATIGFDDVGEDEMSYLGVNRPREVVYVDLDSNCIDLGIDEALNTPRKVYHMQQKGLSVRSDGYIRAFEKLRAALNKIIDPTKQAQSPSSDRDRSGTMSVSRPSSLRGLSPTRATRASTSTRGTSAPRASQSQSTTRLPSYSTNNKPNSFSNLTTTSGGDEDNFSSMIMLSSTLTTPNTPGPLGTLIEAADLAYPNNEHLTPITSFSCEESPVMAGTPLKPFRISDDYYTTDNHKKKSSKKHIGQNAVIVNDQLENNSIHNVYDGSLEIREAFLRLLVFLFQNYEKYLSVDEETEEPNIDRETYLKEADQFKGLSTSSHWAMTQIMSSQMFQRFLQESTTLPEVRFFAEKIIEKQNRGTFGKSIATPFLDDKSDDFQQTYNTIPSFLSSPIQSHHNHNNSNHPNHSNNGNRSHIHTSSSHNSNNKDDEDELSQNYPNKNNFINSFPNRLNRNFFIRYKPPPILGHESKLDPASPSSSLVQQTPMSHLSNQFSQSVRNRFNSSFSQQNMLNMSNHSIKSPNSMLGNNENSATKLLNASLLASSNSSTSNPASSPQRPSRRGSDTMHHGTSTPAAAAVLQPPSAPKPSPPAYSSKHIDEEKKKMNESAVNELSEKTRFALPDAKDRYFKTILGFDRLRAHFRGYQLRRQRRDEKYLRQGILLQKIARRSLAVKNYQREMHAVHIIQQRAHIW